MNILFAGGGTGGHVFPAIAVAEELILRYPETRLLFVGSDRGLEARILPEHGYRFEAIRAGALKGMSIIKKFATLLALPGTIRVAGEIVRQFNADVVVGIGGYASAPALAAATLQGRPTLILEQNLIPGLTNRLLAYFADVAAVNFEESRRFFPGNAVATGNPIRQEFFKVSAPPLESPFTVLVFGGSQGARAINRAVVDALPHLKGLRGRVRFIHQTGPADEAMVRSGYETHLFNAVVRPFFDDMPKQFECSHLVIGRAGASGLGELAATGRPSIIIPLPTAADNHQWKNGEVFERHGAAILVAQANLTGERLARAIESLFAHPEHCSEMARASAALAVPEAASRIVDWVRKLAGKQVEEGKGH
jgi:UDP-N-acetylglucosamine--N-acetylmuramyl-(pentapeptide) pyrophosphoryl-undecaprenol N-acetylglucosamine transferase